MQNIINYLKGLCDATIRRQLMLGIVLIPALLMIIFVFGLVDQQKKFLHGQSFSKASSFSKVLAANSVSSILVNDIIGIEEIMEVQTNYPTLRYAMVLSPEGQVLGHTDRNKVGMFLSDPVSARLLKSKKEKTVLINNEITIDLASPIISGGNLIGWARVNLSEKENIENTYLITRNGFIYMFIAVFVGLLVANFLSGRITRNLKHIIDVADGVKQGDLSLRTNISGNNEVSRLAKDFNLMLETINTSKRDFQSVMDNSSAVIYGKNIDGSYIFTNKKWSSLFGKENNSIIGKTDHEYFDSALADKFRENDLAVLAAGKALSSEEVAPHEDGLHTYISVKFPLLDEDGEIYGICGISTDITDRIKMEKEKSSLERQLFHSQKMQAIGQLAGGIAHDFNNILAAILGYTELSRSQFAKDNKTLELYLSHINTAGVRARDLIQKMMIYSRKDQNKYDMTPMQIDVVLKETLSMLQATFPAAINIETSIQDNLPSVKSNTSLLSQIIMNLCINAKDSVAKEGNLLITLKSVNVENGICDSCHEVYSGEYVELNVKDSGEGISTESIARIFEPFYTTKEIGKGTGMGLPVVHGAVHKLGGHVGVASIVGEGSEFKILLPVSREEVGIVSNEETENVEYDFSDLKIMIIDDEPVIAEFLEESLKLCNAQVFTFTDSKQALSHFERDGKNIDFVITDQSMPDLTGLELSKKFLKLCPDVKIILCTGYSEEATQESVHQLGIKSFLLKPVKNIDLYNTINSLR